MTSAADLVLSAWRGEHRKADGSWQRIAPSKPGLYAVWSFTGHAAVSAPGAVTDDQLTQWGCDGFGGAHDPRLMSRLAGEGGWVDVLDAVLVAPGTGDSALVPRPDLSDHPRVRHAEQIRDSVGVFGWPGRDDVVVTQGLSFGGLVVVSYEIEPGARGQGLGTRTASAARGLVSAGQPVVALVSPGNVASLRAALRAGFEPVGSVQVYRP